jgi:ribosomal protein S18 acetylase RimI-like enzyme
MNPTPYHEKIVGTKLMYETESSARKEGALHMVLDTAEPARDLIKWYNRLGYEFVEYANWDITNYRSVILSKLLLLFLTIIEKRTEDIAVLRRA